ncbi:MAG: four helix bundle protein [Endomicrobiales bacterium]|nr:four helix bundle protein [Endomicrobiales bacterium]
MFGLVAQLRRAAVSIASNIAEGSSRYNNPEKVQFYLIARSSLSEIDTQIEIACRLKFIEKSEEEKIIRSAEELSKLLNGLIRSRRR